MDNNVAIDTNEQKIIIPPKIEYFLGPGEKVLFSAHGNLDNLIKGYLVLTDKKLFFYFDSNITKEKKFIATHPHIASVALKEGLIYSTLIINNSKKESFTIGKINKKRASKFYTILNDIIKK